jgi:hypothetical protein
MTKLKSDISDNKRLKANNLRKIINGITDYTNNVIGLQLVDFQMPDSNRAAEGNIQDVGRIIQVNKRQKKHIGQGFPTWGTQLMFGGTKRLKGWEPRYMPFPIKRYRILLTKPNMAKQGNIQDVG